MRDNRSAGNSPEATDLDVANYAASDPRVDPDPQEYDAVTIDYYTARARTRAELVGAEWWMSVTVYLLFVMLALLIY